MTDEQQILSKLADEIILWLGGEGDFPKVPEELGPYEPQDDEYVTDTAQDEQ